MALITCTECGNQISDRATACPKCGAPAEAASQPTKVAPAKKFQMPVRNATVYDILLSVLMPFWGIIVGMIAICKGETRRGLTMFAATGSAMVVMAGVCSYVK